MCLNVILQEESVRSFLWCNIIHPVSFNNHHHHFTCIYVAVGHHYPFSWHLTSLSHFWTPWSVLCSLHVFTFCHKSLFIWLPYQQSLSVWLPHKNTWATGAHLLPSQWLHIIAHVAICAVILFSWLFLVFVLFVFLSRDSFAKTHISLGNHVLHELTLCIKTHMYFVFCVSHFSSNEISTDGCNCCVHFSTLYPGCKLPIPIKNTVEVYT